LGAGGLAFPSLIPDGFKFSEQLRKKINPTRHSQPLSNPTEFVGLTYPTSSLRKGSSQATLSLSQGSPTRKKCEDFPMPKQKLHQPDADDRQRTRTDHTSDMELLAAASETDVICAQWLLEQRGHVGGFSV